MKIGVVGGGFVGSATALLACKDIEVIIYDLDASRCSPPSTKRSDLLACDVTFVCVPTPAYSNGACNTRIVERCIAGLKEEGVKNIVLRSTVPPGTAERLDVAFMPEFLTEVNWRADFYNCQCWVFGVRNGQEKELLTRLIETAHSAGVIAHKTLHFVTQAEAQLIKYTRNNFFATKISFFNEIAALCKAIGCDYEAVRAGVGADVRIGLSHTGVPGYDGHYGFGGTCLPKDSAALLYFMESKGVESKIVRAANERNRLIDRPEHDWEADPRAYAGEAPNA